MSCRTLPHSMKANYLQEKVGHYGVFNGSRFRNEIVPRIREFHARISRPASALKLVGNDGDKMWHGQRSNVPAGLRVRTPTDCSVSVRSGQFADATLDFLRDKVPKNWQRCRDLVTDNFRVINPKDFRVVT